MKSYILIFLVALFGLNYAYNNIGDRSEEERLADAEYAFKDYLFEEKIDAKNFIGPIIEDQKNGMKRYLWEGVFPGNRKIGIEVYVVKQKSIAPEVGGIGKNEDWEVICCGHYWTPPPENEIYNWFFWRKGHKEGHKMR